MKKLIIILLLGFIALNSFRDGEKCTGKVESVLSGYGFIIEDNSLNTIKFKKSDIKDEVVAGDKVTFKAVSTAQEFLAVDVRLKK